MKVYDSELQVLNLLWKYGKLPARSISRMLNESIGWNKNTTYATIKTCIEKGFIQREEPHYLCSARINKSDVQKGATIELIDKLYDGSKDHLFAALINKNSLTEREIQELLALVEELK